MVEKKSRRRPIIYMIKYFNNVEAEDETFIKYACTKET